jgi:hypothetical protein
MDLRFYRPTEPARCSCPTKTSLAANAHRESCRVVTVARVHIVARLLDAGKGEVSAEALRALAAELVRAAEQVEQEGA